MVLVKCLQCAAWELHWPGEPLTSLTSSSNSAVALWPWKTQHFSMLHSQLFRAGKGGTDLFTHECFCERREASGFHFLPLDSNLGQTREATSMSFYFSSYFKKLLLFYYKSFKSNQTFFQVIIHYYFHIKISQDGETASEIASD